MLKLRTFRFFFIISLTVHFAQAQPPPGPPPGQGPPGSRPGFGGPPEISLQLADHPQKDRIRVDLLIREAFRPLRDEDSVKIYAREAITISKKINYMAGEVRAYGALGDFYGLKDQVDSSYFYSRKAYELSKEIEDRQAAARARLSLGGALSRLGRHKEAQEHYIEVLRIYEEAGEYRSVGYTYERIGSLYIRQGEVDLGISNFEKALDVYNRSERGEGSMRVFWNLGSAYVSKGDFEKALFYLDKAVEMDERGTFMPLRATRGRLYLEMNNLEAAENEFLYAIEFTERVREGRGVSPFYFFLAQTKYRQHDPEAAKFNALEALRILNRSQINDIKGRVGILNLLTDIEKDLENYEQALTYISTARVLADSLHQEENLQAIADIQAKYETEKKEQEILLLQSEKKAGRRLAVMIILEILWVFVVTGIIFWYRVKRREQERKLKLQNVQREMENYGTLVAEKDSFISGVIDKLQNFGRQLKSFESRKELHALVDSLRHNVDLVENEEQLFKRLEQVNSGLFLKLERAAEDDLTNRDKRLASLISIGLSSKDIGNILGISPRSAMQAKYRLKKKLNLGAEEDLDGYLKTISS